MSGKLLGLLAVAHIVGFLCLALVAPSDDKDNDKDQYGGW